MAHGVSAVTIGNMALSHIGATSSIESLSENSAEASQVNLWYDYSREQSLEANDWSFARKRQDLALHSDAAPEPEWGFRYQYPVDALAIRLIVNPAGKMVDAVPFTSETSLDGLTKTILTNMEDAEAVYTFDQQLPSLFTNMFIEALSYLLAHHISYSLTGNAAIKEDMLRIYVALLRIAEAQNANEGVGDKPREAEWIRDR